MLRVFCNVHPANRPRVWQVGEPFETFATRFLGAIRPRDPRLRAVVASRLGIAKGRPTAYDQMMVDLKKASRRPEYQLDAPREVIGFPSGSCWFAITDLVLHGAMSGQHSIDQTWYLPVEAMRDPAHASLRILERLTGRPLA